MAGWNLEHTYVKLPKIFYRKQKPAPAPNPEMVIFNHGLARNLGLDEDGLKDAADIFTGVELPEGAYPIAMAYAGYQFGHFTMLGDGRAVLLGEQVTPDGRRFDIQLKGSGLTPFSREGDGMAALLPMLREYIVSEAMFALGIPTTRSLAVALTGREVYRERVLPGAVLTRTALSHIRVGTFNYVSAFGQEKELRVLADYCIWRHFPQIENARNKYLLLLGEVARLQGELIAKWQLAGFIHGVMNTDNMTISGETIDYGPCAFMDTYDPDTVFSSIDRSGRYAYKNQPAIGAWNLARLAESLLPLLGGSKESAIEAASGEIMNYWEHYSKNWFEGMKKKLGITGHEADDKSLIEELLDIMQRNGLDYTNTFRELMREGAALFEIAEYASWHEKWQARLERQEERWEDIFEIMKKHNPAVIPRNHRVEEALAAAANGDLTVIDNLLEALSKPFEESEIYAMAPDKELCGYKTFCGT